MKFREIEMKRNFVLRLERGDEIIETISNFCKENKIESATIRGIGALSYVKLYSVQDSNNFITKEKEFESPMELISCIGNVTSNEGNEPIIHLHTVLGFSDKSSKVGHLLKGIVSFTGEFFMYENSKIVKNKDKKEGLNLMDI